MKNLKAIVSGNVNEEFYLIKNNEYVGFTHLHELVGSDYTNLNDELMSQNYDTYLKFDFGECVMSISFEEE